MQSYGDFHFIPNFPAFFTPTYSDNSPVRRQNALTASKPVAKVTCENVTELTSVNVQTKDLQSETMITQEHIDNNAAVRRILLERGVVPEDLPAEEDVKKVERRLASEKKKAIENKRKK